MSGIIEAMLRFIENHTACAAFQLRHKKNTKIIRRVISQSAGCNLKSKIVRCGAVHDAQLFPVEKKTGDMEF